jgi:hypothetical protein
LRALGNLKIQARIAMPSFHRKPYPEQVEGLESKRRLRRAARLHGFKLTLE